MGFKIGKLFRNVAKVAAPALGIAFPGIGTAIGGAISSGVEAYEANKAYKDSLGAANRFGNLQQRAYADQAKLSRQMLAEEKVRYDQELQDIEAERRYVQEQIEIAKREGDQEAEDLYRNQINQLDQNLKEVLQLATRRNEEAGVELDELKEKDLELVGQDIEKDEAHSDRFTESVESGLEDVEKGQGALRQELDDIRSQGNRPPWLDSVLSDVEGQLRDRENEINEKYAARNQDTPEGISLALAIQNAKLRGEISSRERNRYSNQRLNNIRALSGDLRAGAGTGASLSRSRASMRETAGREEAGIHRQYGQEKLRRGDELSNFEINQRGNTALRKMATEKDLKSGRINREYGYREALSNNMQRSGSRVTNARGNLSNARITAISGQRSTLGNQADVYGNAASTNAKIASSSRDSRNDAIRDLGGDIYEYIKKKRKDKEKEQSQNQSNTKVKGSFDNA